VGGQGPAIVFWNLQTNELSYCNDEFLDLLEYPTSQLATGLKWNELCLLKRSKPLDPSLTAELKDSEKKVSQLHTLLYHGRLQFASAHVTFVSAHNKLVPNHLSITAIYDEKCNPTQVMWVVQPFTPDERKAIPETDLEAHALELSAVSHSCLVEVKRKKPAPPETRKPWDDSTTKFTLKKVTKDENKRIRRRSSISATDQERAGGEGDNTPTTKRARGFVEKQSSGGYPDPAMAAIRRYSVPEIPHRLNLSSGMFEKPADPRRYSYEGPASLRGPPHPHPLPVGAPESGGQPHPPPPTMTNGHFGSPYGGYPTYPGAAASGGVMRYMPIPPPGSDPRRGQQQQQQQQPTTEFGTFEPNDTQPEFNPTMYPELAQLPLESPAPPVPQSSRDAYMMYGRPLAAAFVDDLRSDHP
jgi:hypothetical protein